MLHKITHFIDTHPIGRIFTLGRKTAVWKKVSQLKTGVKIAVEKNGKLDWDEVVSVKKVGRERVYDIEVEGTHNFVANGIVAHNTYISGNLGIGTTAPISRLQVTNNPTTLTGKAALIVDQYEAQDIIVASASGTTRFRITNTGDVLTQRFVAISNSAYYLDPANTGTSLTTAGNVGIGTVSPGSRLTVGTADPVGGNGNFASVVAAGGTSAVFSDNTNSELYIRHPSSGIIRFDSDSGNQMRFADGGVDNVVILSTGNVGIGTTGPNQKLEVLGTVRIDNTTSAYFDFNPVTSSVLRFTGTQASNNFQMYDGTNYYLMDMYNGATNAVRITASGDSWLAGGNVGIGNAAPIAPLHVSGAPAGTTQYGMYLDTTLTGTAANYAAKFIPTINSVSSGGFYGFDIRPQFAVATGETQGTIYGLTVIPQIKAGAITAVTNFYGGFFRIDNLDDGSPITNARTVYISNPTNTAGSTITNNYGLYIDTQTAGSTLNYAIYSEGGTNYFGGNVGIGTTGPGTKLAVAGLTSSQAGRTICSDTSGNFYYYAGACVASSIKYKENITNLLDQSDQIFQLRPVKFNYKDSGEEDIGLIAEEVAPVLPDLIYYNNGEISGVKYEKLPLYLLQMIKKQQGEIASLSAQLAGITFTDTGDLNIAEAVNGNYQVIDSSNNNSVIDRIGAFAEVVVANLKAGSIETKTLIADSITVGGQSLRDYILSVVGTTQTGVISPISQIQIDVISPLSDTSPGIAVKLNDTQTFGIYSREGTPSATFDSVGNATFSGTLTVSNLTVDADATVAGTLYADRIVARLGDFEAVRTSTVAANFITNINNVTNIFHSTPSADVMYPPPDATSSAFLALGVNPDALTGTNVQINKDVMITSSLGVAGATTLGATTISDSLMVDGSLLLTSTRIESAGDTLYLQKGKLADVNIMDGALIVDTQGNVALAGDLTVAGTIATNTISPLGSGNVTVNLAHSQANASDSGQLAGSFGQLIVKGAGNMPVVAFDSGGNATLSGALMTSRLYIADASPLGATESGNLTGNETIGVATLPANQSQVTISTTKVTSNSFIYLTPVTNPGNHVLYVIDKTPGVGFTIGISSSWNQNMDFNWWIVN